MSIAERLAQDENITLTNEYDIIIDFMRSYWQEHQVAPDVRHVTKYVAEQQCTDKKKAKQLLFKLFPYEYVKQACKIAGMKRPRAWSTGQINGLDHFYWPRLEQFNWPLTQSIADFEINQCVSW